MVIRELNEKYYWFRMKEHKLTQRKLAILVDENEKTISAYIKTANFEEAKLKKIADILGATVGVLWHERVLDDVSSEETDYKKLYYELKEKYDLQLEEINNTLKLKLETHNKLIENIYKHLKLTLPDH